MARAETVSENNRQLTQVLVDAFDHSGGLFRGTMGGQLGGKQCMVNLDYADNALALSIGKLSKKRLFGKPKAPTFALFEANRDAGVMKYKSDDNKIEATDAFGNKLTLQLTPDGKLKSVEFEGGIASVSDGTILYGKQICKVIPKDVPAASAHPRPASDSH